MANMCKIRKNHCWFPEQAWTVAHFFGPRICNHIRQLPMKLLYKKAFSTDCIDSLLTGASATLQSIQ